MQNIVATSQEAIGSILDYVHDRPFDLAAIKIDHTLHLVSIPVRLRAKPKGEVQSELRIYGAESFFVEDNAKIEEGDICKIELGSDRVKIIGSLPVNVFIDARMPRVELYVPENAFYA